jgi:Protein of unknown function (DUF3307)
VPWVEVFVVFVVSHLVGDFLLQTNWQATHKIGGLGRDRESRRALIAHTATYTLAFVPALIWIGIDVSVGWAIGAAALVALPHMFQDDGRLLDAYMRDVKGVGDDAPAGLRLAVDQSSHFISLFLLALLVGS